METKIKDITGAEITVTDLKVYCTPKVGHFWGVFYEI